MNIDIAPKFYTTPAEYRVRVELGTNVVIRDGMNAEPAMKLARKNFQCVSAGTYEEGWNACLDKVKELNQ